MTSGPTDAEMLARLRVAASSGYLPPDLGEWALARVAVPHTARRREVAHALRAAASLLPPGSRWARACALREQIRACRRSLPAFECAELDRCTVPGLVLHALRIAPDCPDSMRQLLRILDGADA